MGFTMTSDYRAKLYRLVFGLAAIYNLAFRLWACLWPRSFFDSVEIASPNYPALWSCLGMVIGLFLLGNFLRLVVAISRSSFLLIALYICLEAPLRDDLQSSPRSAASAAPTAICCFLVPAGIQKDFASQTRNGFVRAAASFRQKK
jgi:hypothetical protein